MLLLQSSRRLGLQAEVLDVEEHLRNPFNEQRQEQVFWHVLFTQQSLPLPTACV